MKTAAVVIDPWKLDIFRRHLTAAGHRFTEHPGPAPDMLTLKVEYEWVAELQPVIAAANQECARTPRADAQSAHNFHYVK